MLWDPCECPAEDLGVARAGEEAAGVTQGMVFLNKLVAEEAAEQANHGPTFLMFFRVRERPHARQGNTLSRSTPWPAS